MAKSYESFGKPPILHWKAVLNDNGSLREIELVRACEGVDDLIINQVSDNNIQMILLTEGMDASKTFADAIIDAVLDHFTKQIPL